MLRWLSCTTLVLLAACSRSPDAPPVVRLVDVFDSATVEGSSDARPSPARTEWRFDSENHGWTALTGLDVRDERLSGRAETELPMLHVERTEGLDDPDPLQFLASIPSGVSWQGLSYATRCAAITSTPTDMVGPRLPT